MCALTYNMFYSPYTTLSICMLSHCNVASGVTEPCCSRNSWQRWTDTVCRHVKGFNEAFPDLYALYVTVVVTQVFSALCHTKQSQHCHVTSSLHTMMHDTKKDLVILAHEKTTTNNLNMDEFVCGTWICFYSKSRRLLL